MLFSQLETSSGIVTCCAGEGLVGAGEAIPLGPEPGAAAGPVAGVDGVVLQPCLAALCQLAVVGIVPCGAAAGTALMSKD